MKIFVSPEDDKTIILRFLKNAAIWIGVFVIVFLFLIMAHKWLGAPYGPAREYNWNKIERELPNIAVMSLIFTVGLYFTVKSDKKNWK